MSRRDENQQQLDAFENLEHNAQVLAGELFGQDLQDSIEDQVVGDLALIIALITDSETCDFPSLEKHKYTELHEHTTKMIQALTSWLEV